MGAMWSPVPSGTNTMIFSATAPGMSKTSPLKDVAHVGRARVGLPLACANMSSSSYVRERVPKHRTIDVKVAARRTGWTGAATSNHSKWLGSGKVQAMMIRGQCAAIPAVPKVLGLSGLIPFYALSPPLLKFAGEALATSSFLAPAGAFLLHDVLPYAMMLQIGYGSAIVSFLGAVHWGAAMQSRTGVRIYLLPITHLLQSCCASLRMISCPLGGPYRVCVCVCVCLGAARPKNTFNPPARCTCPRSDPGATKHAPVFPRTSLPTHQSASSNHLSIALHSVPCSGASCCRTTSSLANRYTCCCKSATVIDMYHAKTR